MKKKPISSLAKIQENEKLDSVILSPSILGFRGKNLYELVTQESYHKNTPPSNRYGKVILLSKIGNM